MSEGHSRETVATMTAVSRAGFPMYCTVNPTNDVNPFPQLLSFKSCSLNDVLVQYSFGSHNCKYFHKLDCFGCFQIVL